MNKIFIVEDDKEINEMICDYLSLQGYETISAKNGFDAVRITENENDISLVILDLMLPFQSGDVALKKIREHSDVPVIIVSAKSTVQSKIDLLKMGADDYLTKPFDLDELAVRIETVLRRADGKNNNKENNILSFKNLIIDRENKTASVNGTQLILTHKEYMMLKLLLTNPKKLFSKANLFESVWKEPYFDDDNIIKVHISNLRNKLKKADPDDEYIETVWGMGYRLVK